MASGARGRCGNPWGPTARQQAGIKSSNPPFVVYFQFRPSRVIVSSPLPPIPNVSMVSKRLVRVDGWNIGARRKASGGNGPLLRSTEPG